uniref:Secreted peptide prohormone-12 n=1 Tax=Schmidtea mediterranea TaxID=79327 RepID=E3CTJ8_SCHMD|nr:TPA_inf: secreted peptide prohormone-12 [Schmidtea mediterranea]
MQLLLILMLTYTFYSVHEATPAMRSDKLDREDWYGPFKRNYMDFFGLNGDMQRFKKQQFFRNHRPEIEWN